MMADDRSQLVLTVAGVLYVNGQATEQMMSAAERLARALGLRATIVPAWGGLQLLVEGRILQTRPKLIASVPKLIIDRFAERRLARAK